MNPDCWPSKGVPLRMLGIRNKEYMQNTGFYTSAFAINNQTTPPEGSRECLWPPEQFWWITPCLSQILKSLHGWAVLWSGWKQRAPLSLWDQPGGASCLGKGDAPSHGQAAVLPISPCLCLHFILKPSWWDWKHVNFYKIGFQAFQKPLLPLQLPGVPASLKWAQGADTAWIFWEVLSGKL